MTRLTLLISLVGVVLLPATVLTAQEAQPDSGVLRSARAMLRSDLRNFLMAQESYFADHNTYAGSLRDMREIYRPSRGVTVVLLTSTNTGHSEIAISDRVPGLVCAIWVGDLPSPVGKGNEGEPVCRGP